MINLVKIFFTREKNNRGMIGIVGKHPKNQAVDATLF